MNILIISSLQEETPPDGYGGIERFVHWLAQELSHQHNVTVICKNGSKGGDYKIITADVDNILTQTIEGIATVKPDVIHLNSRYNLLLDYFSQSRLPLVATLHNNIRESSGWLNPSWLYQRNIYFTTVSKNLEERFMAALGKNGMLPPVNGVKVTWLGFDKEKYQSVSHENTRDYYIYLGVIARYKGVLDIVKEFKKINEKLVVIGPCNDKNQKEYFDEVIREIHGSPNIKYYGETKNDDEKINLLSRAKGLVLATGYDKLEADCYEAFGLVMLEANIMGVSVLGYNKGNIKDYVVDGVNGYKFTDIADLPKLVKMNNSKDLSSGCIKVALQYDIKKIAKNYIEVFKTAILGNRF